MKQVSIKNQKQKKWNMLKQSFKFYTLLPLYSLSPQGNKISQKLSRDPFP